MEGGPASNPLASGTPPAAPDADAELRDPTDLGQRVESEQFVEERRGTELFGLPMMLFVFALIALFKGLATGSTGFTIVGAVVAGGIFLAIGFAMTVAKRE